MRAIVVVCFLAVVAVVLARPEQYTNKYDNLDLDEILHNDRLLESYFKCLLGEGPCSTEGKELKAIMPEALETGCAKCSEEHKKGIYKVIGFLINKAPEKWEKLCAKYDPDQKYRAKYEKELKTVSS